MLAAQQQEVERLKACALEHENKMQQNQLNNDYLTNQLQAAWVNVAEHDGKSNKQWTD